MSLTGDKTPFSLPTLWPSSLLYGCLSSGNHIQVSDSRMEEGEKKVYAFLLFTNRLYFLEQFLHL